MRVVSLSSGSKGNCIFVESNRTKLLIDDGLTFACLSDRLKQVNVLPSEVDAILLTHEHSDHLGGIKTFFEKKTKMPKFISQHL